MKIFSHDDDTHSNLHVGKNEIMLIDSFMSEKQARVKQEGDGYRTEEREGYRS